MFDGSKKEPEPGVGGPDAALRSVSIADCCVKLPNFQKLIVDMQQVDL